MAQRLQYLLYDARILILTKRAGQGSLALYDTSLLDGFLPQVGLVANSIYLAGYTYKNLAKQENCDVKFRYSFV